MPAEPNCDLCGLPCGRQPVTRIFSGDERAFCCIGCMNVYAILLESGAIAAGQDPRQTELFRRSLELGLVSQPAAPAPPPEIPPEAPTREALLQISGMWCSSCAWLIEHGLHSLPGVVSAEVFFASDLAKVRYCPQYLPVDQISMRIRRLGYDAREYTGDDDRNAAATRDLLLRLGVAAFIWANVMAFSVILYVGYFEQIASSANRFVPFILMALATPAVFYSGWPILRAALHGARNRQIRMDALLALGILAAYFYSAAQAFRGGIHVYFDTAAAIVTLVLAGKLIERGAKQRATRSISLLYHMMPRKVRLLSAGMERFVSIEALRSDMIFVVKAGERIPADGVVVEGETHADESLLTGEAAPIAKRPGDHVVSGSLNSGGVIHVRTTKVGADSTLAQIVRLVEGALSSRAPIERVVDRVSRVFVPAIVALAVATFLFCLFHHTGTAPAILRAITVLVIACPCALGLATPLAITAAVGAASREGILVSDSRVLETIQKLDVVVLDKTGTVTQGNFRLTGFAIVAAGEQSLACAAATDGATRQVNAGDVFTRDYLPSLAAVEMFSEHPLGAAVVHRAREDGMAIPAAGAISVRKGEGITGVVNGREVFLGNRHLATALAGSLSPEMVQRAADWERDGLTVTIFGWGQRVRGLLAFGDQIKPDAARMVEELKKRGLEVVLVSGDAAATSAAVARQIGADSYIAEASPAQKAQQVAELQQRGKCVAVVGDGVNDAPALAQADLGIALGSGTDIAMRAAPVVLMSDSLMKVLRAFEISRAAWRIIRQNLFWAFFYNSAAMVLAIAGILNPILAAAAMLISSISVVSNSLRLR